MSQLYGDSFKQGAGPGSRHISVSAHGEEAGVCVRVRRHHGKPWNMAPFYARELARQLIKAAEAAEAELER